MNGIRILVAEDEKKLRDIILRYLDKEGYEGMGAVDGEDALDKWAEFQPDCLILDVMMPKMDGFEVLKNIRETDQVPVIMLTARREEDDKITGFEGGADDYITKPFSTRELLVRIKALLKRSGRLSIDDKIEFERLEILPKEHRVLIQGEDASLTQKEYEVLLYLINNQKLALSREQILERIWGYDFDGEIRVVDTTIKRLRKKLQEEGDYIQTIRGVGYKFVP
ncbi:response regulator transcription factor [Eubacteriaceae bacterium ES3]|nr:response regulator transcription factor [Eubacteriaceae bacterium ES3]